ncbi:MAG: aminoacetone oxidase family FAD-binding enzyme [Gemmatimonadota bacterium]
MRVAVIGAGAAGTMAAIFAAEAGADVILVERTADGGRKILISGGGRCNILPSQLVETRFVTDSSPHTLRNMIRSWPLGEQIAFFERELKLTLVEEPESRKLFPSSNRARDVRDGLLAALRRRGGTLQSNTTVTDLAPEAGRWRVTCEQREPIVADRVILASGGFSVPQTGSDGIGIRIAKALGHTIHPTYAALTPISAAPAPFGDLSGISLEVQLDAESPSRRASAGGGFLFTHRGYSGPAVLDVSHVLVRARLEGEPARLLVQWSGLDATAWEQTLSATGTRSVLGAVRREVPERLAVALTGRAGVEPERTLAQLRRDERQRLVVELARCELPWSGDEGYRKAEVTGGGVSLAEVDPRTMESRRAPGLFLCGEILDAFGPIGGYNFLWAWATGRAAGQAAAVLSP